MFKLIDSLFELGSDATKIVTAPLQIVVDTTDDLIKLLAEGLEEIADEIKSQD